MINTILGVNMEIQHEKIESRGSFYVKEADKVIAEMTYSSAGKGLIIIDHTEVKESAKGKGIGKKLVLEAVAYARENNLKILPLCTFAKSVFQRDESLHDVLRK